LLHFSSQNNKEHYSRVPRLSDTLYSAKGTKGLGGLWALEWAWHIRVTYLRCVQGYGI